MTDRLYYTDPYFRTFDARVETVERGDGRLIVTLDRTAFYPTSGGQPFDTGTLGAFAVVDVIDRDDGTIAHVIEIGSRPGPVDPAGPKGPALQVAPRTPHPAPGTRLVGTIDWSRRFDHMQQHTGQHVLSAAFDHLFGARTVSFHLGAAASTIDLEREMTPAEIAAAEDEANRIVWEDRPVVVRFVTAAEAATLPLRKEPARGGTLRLIDVEGFDLSACGGTHVARTGGIGVIAVASWERFKGGQRLEFLCGGRALGRFRSMRDSVTAGVRLLSALPEELPAAIARMQADAKDQKRAIVALQTELSRFRAEELAASAEEVPLEPDATIGRLVLRVIDADANGLKALASAITVKPGFIVALFSTSRPALVVVARSAGVAVASNQVLTALTTKFGGRGGGKPELAQGGGLDAAADALLEAARAVIAVISHRGTEEM
ncbi:MAG: alanyl-tRNA editing protein [Acidobacteria bacterium]|nr:alanyl-tRNA editing protein [Acidobacteriota bacterium]